MKEERYISAVGINGELLEKFIFGFIFNQQLSTKMGQSI